MEDAWQKVFTGGAVILVPTVVLLIMSLLGSWLTRRYTAQRDIVLQILLEHGATNLHAPLIVEHSDGRLSGHPSQIYPLLHRMKREDWLSSYEPNEPLRSERGYRPRICYRLTAKGSLAAAGLYHGATIPS